MPEITTFLPQYEFNLEYNVSTHPINYAIWYEYVVGNNGKLNAAVDVFEEINADLNKLLGNTIDSLLNPCQLANLMSDCS